MPIEDCTSDGRPGYRYGSSGTCYTYDPNSEEARKEAKRKAYVQAYAVTQNTGEPMPKAGEKAWGVGASRDLPTSDDSSWDGAAAERSIFEWAGWPDNPNPAKAKRGFLVANDAEPQNKGSYRLPFARVVNGRLTASRAGLRAAASRLPQTDVPPDVRSRAHAVIESYMRAYHAEDNPKAAHAPMLVEKLFDTRHEKALESATALAAINQFAPEPVSAEDVYIGRAVLANDKYDRSHERFTPEILGRFAETIIGKSVLPGHDRKAVPLGRWFGASVRSNPDGSHDLVADFYLRAKSEIADLVRTGIAQHVSIGFSADQRTCDLDGTDYDRCKKHKAGSTYDGKLATVTYGGETKNYEAREGSFVWLGCQYGAQVEGAKDAFDAHSGHIVWKSADEDDSDFGPGDEGMTEQEKADFDARGDELKSLKIENEALKAKAAAGEAYLESLRGEIKRKADVLKEDSSVYAKLLAAADLETLKSWDADLQKRFDAKFPPSPKSQMRGHGAADADGSDQQAPNSSGRFGRLPFGQKAQGG